MAITQTDGAKLAFFVEGEPVPYMTKIDLQFTSGQKPEITMNGTLIWSPGQGAAKIPASFIVPADYQAFHQQWCARGSFVSVQVNVGASVFAAVGKITEINFSASAGGSSEGSFTWEGPLEEMLF